MIPDQSHHRAIPLITIPCHQIHLECTERLLMNPISKNNVRITLQISSHCEINFFTVFAIVLCWRPSKCTKYSCFEIIIQVKFLHHLAQPNEWRIHANWRHHRLGIYRIFELFGSRTARGGAHTSARLNSWHCVAQWEAGSTLGLNQNRIGLFLSRTQLIHQVSSESGHNFEISCNIYILPPSLIV